MRVLVTGGMGQVGSKVVEALSTRKADVRVLAREQPKSGPVPANVDVAVADMLDPVALEKAMQDVDKLFLLNAVAPDELTQALITHGVAKRAGVKHITYLSVFKVEQFRNVPHFASKLAMEAMLREMGLPHTILRPGYYMQNDVQMKDSLLNAGIYPNPIGTAGMATADIRDIAEAAAISLTEEGHEGKTYNIVSPTLISGLSVSALWSKLLGKPIQYGGHDFDKWEQAMRGRMPAWSAYDVRAMFQAYFDRGFASTETDVQNLTTLLGRAPRSYEDFATETAANWKQ